METSYSCCILKNTCCHYSELIHNRIFSVTYMCTSGGKHIYECLCFYVLETLVSYCAQKLLMCVYFQIKMSIIQSLSIAKAKLEREKYNSQKAQEKSSK